MMSRLTQISIVLLARHASHVAKALVVETTSILNALLRSALTEIDAVANPVVTMNFDDAQSPVVRRVGICL